MICKSCGNRVPENYLFCPYCGVTLNKEDTAQTGQQGQSSATPAPDVMADGQYLPVEGDATISADTSSAHSPEDDAVSPDSDVGYPSEELIYTDNSLYGEDEGEETTYSHYSREYGKGEYFYDDIDAADNAASYSPTPNHEATEITSVGDYQLDTHHDLGYQPQAYREQHTDSLTDNLNEYMDGEYQGGYSGSQLDGPDHANYDDTDQGSQRADSGYGQLAATTEFEPGRASRYTGKERRELYKTNRMRRKRALPLVLLVIVLVLAIAAGVYFLVLPKFGIGGSPVNKLVTAIESDNEKEILTLVPKDQDGNQLSNTDIQPFLAMLKDPAYKTALVDALKAGKECDIITDQATGALSMRKFKLKVTTAPAGAQLVFKATNNINEAKNGTIEAPARLPGDYEFSVHYEGVIGGGRKEYKVRLSTTSPEVKDGVYQMDASIKTVTVSVGDAWPEAVVLVNGENTGKTLKILNEEKEKMLGPIPVDSEVSLELKTPAGTVVSDTVKATEDKQEMSFTFSKVLKIKEDAPADEAVFLNGQEVGKVEDYKAYDYMVAADEGSNKLSLGEPGETETTPSGEETKPSGESDESKPAATVDESKLPYSKEALGLAKEGKLDDSIKNDVLAAIGTFIREDVQGAKTTDINVYTNLVDPQLSRHVKWLNGLKEKKMSVIYEPKQVDFWDNSWHVSYKDGELLVDVTESYKSHYTVIQDGKQIESNDAVDNWTHYLRYDTDKQMWVIYKNEVPEQKQPDGPVDSYGF